MVSEMKIRLSCGEICSKGIVWIAFSHKIKLCSFHQAFPCWGWEIWNPPTRLQSLLTYLLYWGTHYLSTKSLLFQRIKIDNSQKRCKCSKTIHKETAELTNHGRNTTRRYFQFSRNKNWHELSGGQFSKIYLYVKYLCLQLLAIYPEEKIAQVVLDSFVYICKFWK